jgi:hypothetical protein
MGTDIEGELDDKRYNFNKIVVNKSMNVKIDAIDPNDLNN